MMSLRQRDQSPSQFTANIGRQESIGWSLRITQLCVLVILAGLISVWLGQDANWDLQNYHLYNAFALLNNRYALDPGATPQWYLNPLLDVPYYLLTQYLVNYPEVVAFIQGTQTGIVWFLLWRLLDVLTQTDAQSHRIIRVIAWIAACTGTMLISETGTTFGDVQTNILTLASLLCVLHYIKDNSKTSYLLLGYFLVGAATGLKLTNAIYLIAALISLPLIIRRVNLLVPVVLAAVGGMVLSGGWWALYLQLHYSSPLFPFYNRIFHSDWWPQVNISDNRFFPKSIIQWLIYPAFWLTLNKDRVTEVQFADGRMLVGLLSAMAIGAVCCSNVIAAIRLSAAKSATPKRVQRDACLSCAFFLISYVIWLCFFSIYRYAITLESLSPLLVYLVATRVFANSERVGQVLVAACGCLLVAVMGCTRYPNWMRAEYSTRVLSVKPDLEYDGATILAAAGNPPISYLFTQLRGASHFITVSDGFRDTKLFNQQARIINGSNNIYVIKENGLTPYLPGLLHSYWGLVRSSAPCVKITTNIGGPFDVCKMDHNR